MSVLQQLANFQNRNDEVPNVELARALAASRDRAGIAEIAAHVWDDNPAVQADCIKVLYEIGYVAPELVANYAEDFLNLLASKNNRLVWGAASALATIAPLKPDVLFKRRAELERAVSRGSVITQDNGIKALALVAASSPSRRKAMFPYLLNHLKTCRHKDVPQHAEHFLVAVNASNKEAFVGVLNARLHALTPPQAKRVNKVVQRALSLG